MGPGIRSMWRPAIHRRRGHLTLAVNAAKADAGIVHTNHGEEELETLETAECLRLMGAHHFGRISFGGPAWPVILPVNYIFEEPNLVIRTAPGEKLEFVPMTAVAFEIDEADPDGEWGWSVLVQGPALDITEAADTYSGRLRAFDVTPWAPGRRDHWLKITAVEVSGRWFGQPPR